MRLPLFIRAFAGKSREVIYESADGRRFSFSGGDPNWRNHNPGNLVPGKVSSRNGAIGKAGQFAIFPSYEAGHSALLDSLKNIYGEKSISEMIQGYAPNIENNTSEYFKFLQKQTGVKDGTKIKNFTPIQFEKLWKAIERYEGTKKGKITELTNKKQIDAVRKNKKGTITHYRVEDMGWITKDEAIQLTEEGKIDAVVATSRSGNLFLRMRPDVVLVNNLKYKG